MCTTKVQRFSDTVHCYNMSRLVNYLSQFVRVYSFALWPIRITSKQVRIINSRVFVQRKGKLGLSLDQKSSFEPSVQIGLFFFSKMNTAVKFKIFFIDFRQLSFTCLWHPNQAHGSSADEQPRNNKYQYLPC